MANALILLGNCVEVPELDATVPTWVDDAPYPDLVPIEAAMVSLPRPVDQREEINETLNARADGLRARADALRRPVIDKNAKDRMSEGVSP